MRVYDSGVVAIRGVLDAAGASAGKFAVVDSSACPATLIYQATNNYSDVAAKLMWLMVDVDGALTMTGYSAGDHPSLAGVYTIEPVSAGSRDGSAKTLSWTR